MSKLTIPALALLALLPAAAAADPLFVTHETCIACHNGLTTSAGREVSIGFDWRASMMANSARDPYWQAAVRREVTDHPAASAAIQHECSACHMPMMRYQAKVAGGEGKVFANLTAAAAGTSNALLAGDGVSCSMCHQITPEKLGSRESFTAGFVVDTKRPMGERHAYGPYQVERGLSTIMRTSAELVPEKSLHVQKSEMCASCHTLITHALGPNGEAAGTLPEQVPYLEWKHSAYRDQKSCQDCHMPVVKDDKVPVASVLGQPREGFSRHVFRGGNFFMPRMLNRHRAAQGVVALPQELDAVARRAVDHLRTRSARVQVVAVRATEGVLEAEVSVTNLAGHKLPTAYPSRRAWLHVVIRDGAGKVLLESGALQPDGAIRGNDNDADAARFEPHHDVIRSGDQVQIYESIMVDHAGKVTTGLLKGLRYIKDNRVLPRGFDKGSASSDVAVHGAAAKDPDFVAAGDRVTYRVPVAGVAGPFHLEVALVYQPIGHRWAHNLGDVSAPEPRRFIGYYRAMAPSSSVVLAQTSATWEPPPPPASAPAAEPTADN